ncbi:hypothetical protein QVD17_21052 [Tagetes erecta]|uniref:Uncharacterized protein n=1 Tax=Tagetes erecta TaxID=13708 RepID=A0AAD8KST4_TARER|nr:hypothetical protein QVD17_21052 [Tagetes erecta]
MMGTDCQVPQLSKVKTQNQQQHFSKSLSKKPHFKFKSLQIPILCSSPVSISSFFCSVNTLTKQSIKTEYNGCKQICNNFA